MFENETLPIPCLRCGQETEKSIGWIKANTDFTCPACGAIGALDRDKLLAALQRMDDALAAFERKGRKPR